MRFPWPLPPAEGYWLTPAAAGVVLILIGVLICAEPRLLAYFVAALFLLAGATLLSVAWRMRRRVTYRRLDDAWEDDDQS